MDDYYSRLVENLGKLQRNESQMTEEQKVKYKKPLMKLKNEIADDATRAAREFVLMGMNHADDTDSPEWEKVISETQRLIDEWKSQGGIKKASKILFDTYDLDAFFTALCPIHTTIWFKAYGGYWLKHISETGEKEYPYYNDLLDMHWWEECNEWAKTKIDGGKRVTDYFGGVTIMLPPTQERIDREYKREMESYEGR